MTAPALPTRSNLNRGQVLYQLARQFNYMASKVGASAPALPLHTDFNEDQVWYNILTQVRYLADGFADAVSADQVPVKNATGGTLARDALVRLSGWDEAAQAFNIVIADADASAASGADYVLRAAILNTAVGVAYKTGRSVATLNTNAGNVGDPVYLSTTAGTWTLTAPTGNDDTVQQVGTISVKSATVGVIQWDLQGAQVWGTNNLEALSVTGAKLATGVLNCFFVDGHDETTGPTPNYTVTGIAVGDEIVAIIMNTTKASIASRSLVTGFTVTAPDTITSGSAVNRANNQLEVWYIKKT